MWKIVGLALFALGFPNGIVPQTLNLTVSVAYFPLNGTYGLEELCNRAPTGNVAGLGDVRLAPGPDGLAQGSHELSGGGFIEFPNEPGGVLDIRYSMSMLFWVFPNESNTLYILVHYRNVSGDEVGPTVGRTSIRHGLEITLASRDGSVIGSVNSNALPSGVWSHVAFTYDNNTGDLKLLLNGAVIDTVTAGSSDGLATQYSLIAGSGDAVFTGRITQIAVYDESLSVEQVAAISSGESQVTCVCDPATQFTCDNAFCIDLDKRCDDIADCRDRSDERGCILSRDEDPSGIVDCGNNGTGITITIINIRDVTQWIRDSDEWRLNDDNDDDCAPTFGVSNATYVLRFGSDCAAVVSESDAFVYTFIINASKQGFSVAFTVNHFYSIRCGYGRNGTVFSSFDTVDKLQASVASDGAEQTELAGVIWRTQNAECRSAVYYVKHVLSGSVAL